MRHLIFFLLFSNTAFGQKASQEFTLTVYPNSLQKGQYIYLSYRYSDTLGLEKIDSQLVLSNQVVFRGYICQPAPARIYSVFNFPLEILESLQNDTILEFFFPNGRMELPFEFFLMPGETNITSNKSILGSTISGEIAVLDFEILKQAKCSANNKMESLLEKIGRCQNLGDKECVQQFTQEFSNLEAKIRNDVYLDYYRKNINSPLAFYALKTSIPQNLDSSEVYLERLFKLPKKVKEFPEAITLKKFLEASRKSHPGMYVQDFEQIDTSGNRIAFKSFTNKYVLVYFWASSSSFAFRKVHADLFPIWSKYQNRNFTVVSIGLETIASREKWVKIIRENKMPWSQLTDFKGFLNAAAQQFGVLFVPFNLLVDPEGKIVMRNVQIEELDRYLSSVLK